MGQANGPRTEVLNTSPDKMIDADYSVYGVPWFAGENTLLTQLGPPDGVLFLNMTDRIYFYGATHAFVFDNNELRELYISLFDLARVHERIPIRANSKIDAADWELSPGIRPKMSRKEIETVLNRRLDFVRHDTSYATEKSIITLTFYGTIEDEDARTLSGLHIRRHQR